MDGGNDALTAAVASAKRHQHALAGFALFQQTLGNAVIKLPVKGKGSLFYRD